MGLYLSGLDFFAGTGCEGLGLPTSSRAISRTALAAVKVFFFLFLPAIRASSHRN